MLAVVNFGIMKNPFKKEIMFTDSKIELIEPNYEGIAMVLAEFKELYRVCDNTKLLDKCLENFCIQKTLITNKD